jgi:hypothetical protein
MIVDNPADYRLLKFARSRSRGKKYDAILLNRHTRKEKRVPFGALGYEQYRDSTGVGLYSRSNHGDPKRRRLYRTRHAGENARKFSSGYFSWKYLW